MRTATIEYIEQYEIAADAEYHYENQPADDELPRIPLLHGTWKDIPGSRVVSADVAKRLPGYPATDGEPPWLVSVQLMFRYPEAQDVATCLAEAWRGLEQSGARNIRLSADKNSTRVVRYQP